LTQCARPMSVGPEGQEQATTFELREQCRELVGGYAMSPRAMALKAASLCYGGGAIRAPPDHPRLIAISVHPNRGVDGDLQR
jgi:hypothetical protein